ncbi:GNAT family N-acetyltransferase [Bacillus suaedaesalsae]|uniref:GNAT family N-acetyltransferase n=1 Tax=Bacillus suaedaesalsae TaxID=2810349 RepID=A0ABS2DJJ1_9BACI|nr:GNAT family N-acetyltransferase [Bacillus suaedaesalsae]MBM6618180.1 GNAT family N-acetyltransferase [Bacillus suaedaesalsae]
MEVKIVTNNTEFEDALKVRREVFIEEQQVPEEEEIDQYEDICTHVVVYDDNKPVATGRLRDYEGIGKLERICVLSSHRSHGLGKVVMDQLESIAEKQGFSKLKLNAQTHAEGFYAKLGYETVSDIFMDAGIPHVTMVKIINAVN